MSLFSKIFLWVLGLFALSSCIKEEIAVPVNPDDNGTVSQENISQSIRDLILAETVFTDALVTAMDITSFLIDEIEDPNTTSFVTNYGDCNASVTLSKSGSQISLEVSFPDGDNCEEALTGWDKTGTLQWSFTQNYFVVGSEIALNFNSYQVNDIAITGQHIAENISTNSDTLVQNLSVENAILTFADGSTIEYSSDKTSLWVEGLAFPNLSDDVFLLSSGSYVATNRLGNAFNASVLNDEENPVRIRLTCWENGFLLPSQGQINLSSLGENAAALYGVNGEGCNSNIDAIISYSFDN